jgi:rubrerythrin
LPVIRVKRGNPFLQCQSCGSLSHGSGEAWDGYLQEERPVRNCPYCSKPLDPEFRFCPFCGKSI